MAGYWEDEGHPHTPAEAAEGASVPPAPAIPTGAAVPPPPPPPPPPPTPPEPPLPASPPPPQWGEAAEFVTWGGSTPSWAPAAPATPPLSTEQLPAQPPAAPAVDWSAAAPLPSAPSAPRRRRLVIAGAALSVLAVIGVVAGFELQARASGVHAALASVLASPTLQVVATAQVPNPSEEATVSQYSVVLTVTSKNASAPISSGSDNIGAYEISVLRSGSDIVDVVGTDSAIYARVNLRAISQSTYEQALQSLASGGATGAAYTIESDVVHDQWVGVSLATLRSLESALGTTTTQIPTASQIANLRNAFTMSFSQSWDTWTSIHQLSSSNGTTEYSLTLPVEHFVASFLADMNGAITKDLPTAEAATAARELGAIESSVHEIPAGLEIPMTMWVTNGSLSRLQVSYEGYSANLDFSHPAVGVTAPQGAFMISAATIKSLIDSALGCTASGTADNGGALCPGTGISSITGVPGVSGITGITGISSSSAVAVGGMTSSSNSGGATG